MTISKVLIFASAIVFMGTGFSYQHEVPKKEVLCTLTENDFVKVETYVPEIKHFQILKAKAKKEQPRKLSHVEEVALCNLAWAEARGEGTEGMRLVIDTVLNRVDNKKFPNSIIGVVYAPKQFSCIHKGHFKTKVPKKNKKNILLIVREETVKRKNSKVLYFTSRGYLKRTKPLFKYRNHYFSN
jgi:spore germination cell wall hydrolase CwlJ-like protein